jgi:glycerophosphoryl diester phosphodiesterase
LRTVLRLAHRGDTTAATENSLAALVAACRRPGVDGVEFDVRLSGDRVPVVCHDADLRRTHGMDLRLADAAAVELERLGVPSLASVLDALPDTAWLDVELKEDAVAAAAPLLEAARGPAPERVAVSSFDATILFVARRLLPGWPRWLLVQAGDEAAIATAWGLGCAALACNYRAINARSADLARSAGLPLVAWTVTRSDTLARLERLNVFAACVEGAALRRGSGTATSEGSERPLA